MAEAGIASTLAQPRCVLSAAGSLRAGLIILCDDMTMRIFASEKQVPEYPEDFRALPQSYDR